MMVIQTACAVAIYCQRCGHIHVQDVPLFTGKDAMHLRCSSCGHEMARAFVRPHDGLRLELDCGVCGSKNVREYNLRQLHNVRLEKLYCAHDHFELGYLGRHKDIERFLACSLYPGEQGMLERQQLLLEALNRIHDLAFAGELTCDCGSRQIMAALEGEEIVLTCGRCGSFARIPAHTAADLQQLRPGMTRKIIWKHLPFLDAGEK